MRYNSYQQKQIVTKKVTRLIKSGKPGSKQEANSLRKWLNTRAVDVPDHIVRTKRFAEISKEVDAYRLCQIVIKVPVDEQALEKLSELFVEHGEDIASLEFVTPLDCPASSPALTKFIRSLTTLKSLRKVYFGQLPYSQPFFAALFVTNIQVLEIVPYKSEIRLNDDEYNALCLFLESYPHLKRLLLHFRRPEDPGLNELFLAMSKNASKSLQVSIESLTIFLNLRILMSSLIRCQLATACSSLLPRLSGDSPSIFRLRSEVNNVMFIMTLIMIPKTLVESMDGLPQRIALVNL